MLTGSFGAALIGFILTAIPEFSDTERLRGRPLFILAALWMTGRVAGFLGAEPALPVAAAADLTWLGALYAYIAAVSIRKRTAKLTGFLFWIACLWLAELAAQYVWLAGDIEAAQRAIHVFGLAFLGLALARITVPITNRVLDPAEETSPFRPASRPAQSRARPDGARQSLAAGPLDAAPHLRGAARQGAACRLHHASCRLMAEMPTSGGKKPKWSGKSA